MEEIVEKLKMAKIAYELAKEYDYSPSPGDKGYVEGLEVVGLSGCRPDEVAEYICSLIDQL